MGYLGATRTSPSSATAAGLPPQRRSRSAASGAARHSIRRLAHGSTLPLRDSRRRASRLVHAAAPSCARAEACSTVSPPRTTLHVRQLPPRRAAAPARRRARHPVPHRAIPSHPAPPLLCRAHARQGPRVAQVTALLAIFELPAGAADTSAQPISHIPALDRTALATWLCSATPLAAHHHGHAPHDPRSRHGDGRGSTRPPRRRSYYTPSGSSRASRAVVGATAA